MTTLTNPELWPAFRAFRSYGGGQYRSAGLALDHARQALHNVDDAARAYDREAQRLADLWESLGKAEPKRYSPEGEQLAHARNAARDARKLLTRANRAVSYSGPARPWHGPQSSGKGHVYFEQPGAVFRNVADASDLAQLDHTGWYDNPYGESSRDGSGLVMGVVAQLPGRNGCARYVAGWRNGSECGDGATFDLACIFESDTRDGSSWDTPEAAREAARAADGLAESAAEAERGYQESWQAGGRYADAGERLESIRDELAELLAERRLARVPGNVRFAAICKAVADRVAQLWEERAELREEREQLADDCPCDMRHAFADGAGGQPRSWA